MRSFVEIREASAYRPGCPAAVPFPWCKPYAFICLDVWGATPSNDIQMSSAASRSSVDGAINRLFSLHTPVETIQIAETDTDIAACFPVMRQLRPHLLGADFVDIVRRQMEGGYSLAFLATEGTPRAVAGFRFIENLASGRLLYVDDLVTDAERRSAGHGEKLFGWLVERARERGCNTLELDSGVQRHGAHRFYLMRRMEISSYHFRLRLLDG